MTANAIRVDNLGKRYRIGTKREPAGNHGRIMHWLSAPFQYLMSTLRPPSDREIIWALRDASFEVERGEVVGIIGRNGAGKSTLLKLLSRITEPTTGHARLHGRVGSLLEVGTGFHPELTGRENIFLSGAILGMRRREVARKFDEIIGFAEIEKFLDTPVKRYSSGMYVRLAFAVAAHLEPEILLVDEVLAVGDAAFQKKCLGKMGDVATQGRTVLFVSHNMVAIQNLCERALLLDGGKIMADDVSSEVVKMYLSPVSEVNGLTSGYFDLRNRQNTYSDYPPIIQQVTLLDSERTNASSFFMGHEMNVMVSLDGLSKYRDAQVGIFIKSQFGQKLCAISTGMTCEYADAKRQLRENATLTIPKIYLTPGVYSLDVSVAQKGIGRLDYVENAGRFEVLESDIYGTGHKHSSYFGLFYIEGSWKIFNDTGHST